MTIHYTAAAETWGDERFIWFGFTTTDTALHGLHLRVCHVLAKYEDRAKLDVTQEEEYINHTIQKEFLSLDLLLLLCVIP